ncbi:MAG TPA: alpha/beta hydrolase-fold protein [Candidatus Polarisedimenticolaceae bacterium]|nr:alpha/beta hydrolase-fold protein [Candidatus Polarisedimenticolaceae bacterium]
MFERWIADGPPAADELSRRLAEHVFPLVERRSATFAYHGKADDVRLRHWIFGLPSSQSFRRIEGTDLWHFELELPERSRVEYKIERLIGGHVEWIMDPLNPRVARDPFGANSVCFGEGYETPSWTLADPDARLGTVDEIAVPSRAFGGARRLLLYLPARFRRRRRYPLLVFHDGEDYLRYAALRVVLDNLIHRLEIPPLIAALLVPVARNAEYAAKTTHAEFLRHELVPLLERRLPLIPRTDSRALVGASFGAVAALHAAWTYPGFWGGLLLQSGSFAFSDIGQHRRGPQFDPIVRFVNRFREQPGQPAERLFQSCGTYESLIYENRSIVPLFQSTGMELRYVEARDGHNWENWRDRLREGLSWLFPGPLWMVYE